LPLKSFMFIAVNLYFICSPPTELFKLAILKLIET